MIDNSILAHLPLKPFHLSLGPEPLDQLGDVQAPVMRTHELQAQRDPHGGQGLFTPGAPAGDEAGGPDTVRAQCSAWTLNRTQAAQTWRHSKPGVTTVTAVSQLTEPWDSRDSLSRRRLVKPATCDLAAQSRSGLRPLLHHDAQVLHFGAISAPVPVESNNIRCRAS